jgi:hypothetical protein
VRYQGNEIKKPLHSNGYLSIVAHVGYSHIAMTGWFANILSKLPLES